MIYQGGIKQIMPAPENLYVRYYDDIEGYFYMPIIGIALCEDGEVMFLDSDSNGNIDPVEPSLGKPVCRYYKEKNEYIIF